MNAPQEATFLQLAQTACAWAVVLQGGQTVSGATYNPCAESHCHHACSKYPLFAYRSTDEALGVGTRHH